MAVRWLGSALNKARISLVGADSGSTNRARLSIECVGEDPGFEFSSECESAYECLQRLIKVYHFNLHEEEIATTYYQLKNKEIIISIHGRHNCGKSSLINALLGKSLLPMSILNETGVKVKIEHDETVHPGICPHPSNRCCEHCPQLFAGKECTEEGQIVPGCEDIRKHLKRVNEEVRTNKDQKSEQHVNSEFVLTTNVPMLASTPPGWKISLLDNPGFGESHQEHMIDRTKTTLKTSSAYLVIMDVGQLGDKEDEDCLKLICDADEGAFDDHGRVLIAVTKYDTMYQERKDDRKSEEEIREIVQKNVNTATHRHISKDAIVPVCGKWALHVRLLQRDPSDDYSRDQIIAGLKSAEVPRGQTEDPSQMNTNTLSIHMDGVTKIAELEERIKKMTSRCAYIWIHTMTTNYHRYITEGLAEVTPKLDEKKDRLKATEAFRTEMLQHYRSVSDLRQKVQRSIQKDQSEVHRQILRSAHDDVQGTKERVRQLVQAFGERCRNTIQQGNENFGDNELLRDVNQLLNDQVRPNLVVEIYNASERFRNAVERENTAVGEMKNDIRSLTQAAQLYIQPRPVCHNLPIIVEQAAPEVLEDGVGEEAADFTASDRFNVILNKEKPTFEDLQQVLDIPPLEISLMRYIANGFRSLFHALFPALVNRPVKAYRSYDNMAGFMGQLQQLVNDAAEGYLRDFEQLVADFFFEKYCGVAERSLSDFERQLGSKLEKQKENDDAVIEGLKKGVRDLEAEKNYLKTHQAKITEKAEKYKNALEKGTIAPKPFQLSAPGENQHVLADVSNGLPPMGYGLLH